MRDKIYIEKDRIRLVGFDDITERAIFRLLPAGIIIARFDPEDRRPFCYEVEINSERIIEDPLLVSILRARKIEAENEFFHCDDLYYEVHPHARLDD